MSACSKGLFTLALASALSVPASAQLLSRKDLSYEIAKSIAEGAIAECHRRGYNTSVVVVDRAGDTLIAMRYDNASPHTMENARRKAYTAVAFKTLTSDYAKKLQDPNSVVHQQVTLPNIVAIPGGVPIKIGDEIIGAVGVSGSPGVDEECVNAALDKVKDQLQ